MKIIQPDVKKIILLSVITLSFLVPFPVLSQGNLTNVTFFSSSLNSDRNVQVYLPPGYDEQGSTKYPVIYYLHGVWGDHKDYGSEIKKILDNLIADKTISPIIVVKPDGSVEPWIGSFYINSELYGDFEDYIISDLVTFIDTTYNTIAKRDGRIIWGYSMGGYGAMFLALKHPELFYAVASHSGSLGFGFLEDWIPRVLFENGGVPVSEYERTREEKPATFLLYNVAGAYSPNLNNPPHFIDFPLDNMGNIIDSVFNRWLPYDPALFAANLSQDYDFKIYFDCGKQDELFLYPVNLAFKDSLENFGIPYVFESFIGNHENKFEERIPIALTFLDSVWSDISAIDDRSLNSISSFKLNQNYPNPFNPKTTIEYTVKAQRAVPQRVNLSIYNLLGQKVATLVNKKQAAGTYQVEWDAHGYASGVYMYRLTAGDFAETKKLVLLK